MKNKVENLEMTEKRDSKASIPFLLKAAALLIIVYGIFGLAYYTYVVLYSTVNTDFFMHLEYHSFRGNSLYLPLTIEFLIHLGLILSGFLMIYRKKVGAYLFYSSFFVALVFSVFVLDYINLTEIIIGSILLIIILVNRNHLS